MTWPLAQKALMVEHYSSKGIKFVATLLGRTEQEVMAKAYRMGLRVEFTQRCGRPFAIKPKPSGPTLVIAQPKRGPAYSDGPMVFTDKTRHTVCPSMPQCFHTNTHSNY